jgi:hypothetical protein
VHARSSVALLLIDKLPRCYRRLYRARLGAPGVASLHAVRSAAAACAHAAVVHPRRPHCMHPGV